MLRQWVPADAGRLRRKVDRLKVKYDRAEGGAEIEAFLSLYRLALKMAQALDRLGAL